MQVHQHFQRSFRCFLNVKPFLPPSMQLQLNDITFDVCPAYIHTGRTTQFITKISDQIRSDIYQIILNIISGHDVYKKKRNYTWPFSTLISLKYWLTAWLSITAKVLSTSPSN